MWHVHPTTRNQPHACASATAMHIFPRHSILVFKEALTVIGLVLLFCLLALIPMLTVPHGARAATPVDSAAESADLPAGLFFRSGREDALLEAPGLTSDVVIRVSGEVARARVRQRFVNPSSVWLEGIYVFPLPQGSAVDRLVMTVGERRIEGRILPREQAEKVYKQAAAEGRKASLLSSERPNVFVASLANIGPGEEITVEIEYQDRALYRDGRFELRFPMVVAPRYTPSGEAPLVTAPAPADPLQPPLQPIAHQSETEQPPFPVETPAEAPGRDLFGPVKRPGTGQENGVTLVVHLNAGLPLAEVKSLYHAVSIETLDAERRIITLAEGSAVANRDFVLAWAPQVGAAPEAAVFADEVEGESYLAVTLVPPSPIEPEADSPRDTALVARELILIVDTSGSMHGPSIAQAKRALLLALDRLHAEDRFNVIRFDNEAEALFAAPRPATDANLRRAGAYVASFAAEGGTNMRPALTMALRQPAGPDHLRQVVFLTDGAVSNEKQLFATIAARLEGARLFTVGLGSAPNGYFMRKAAEVGRGTFTTIGDLAETEARMAELFRKLESPVLTDLEVDWPAAAGGRVDVHPSPLPDLYAGETITFTARLPEAAMNELAGALLVTGRTGAEAWQRRVSLANLEPAPGVAALWARARIAGIRDGLHLGRDPEAVRREATEVALKHRLVSVYTSLVAVDEVVSRPEGAPLARSEMPRELPDGWSYEHVFGAAEKVMRLRAVPASMKQALATSTAPQGQSVGLPQTATPATQQALLGLGLAALGAYLLLFAGRLRRARTGCNG